MERLRSAMNQNIHSIPISQASVRPGVAIERHRPAALYLVASISFAGVLLLSSMYCLLAYIPSIYFSFIHAPFMGWMPLFARTQPYLFALTFCFVAIPRLTSLRHSRQKRLAIEVFSFGAGVGIYLFYSRPLQFIQNDAASFVWAVVFLFQICCLGALEYSEWLPWLEANGENRISFSYPRVIGAAVFVGILYPGMAYLRYYLTAKHVVFPASDAIAWGWAVLAHILLFLMIFSVIDVAAQICARAANPGKAKFLIFTGLWWLATAFILDRVVLASIPFEGFAAGIYATMLSLAVVTVTGGSMLRARIAKRSVEAINNTAKRSRKLEEAALWLFLLAANLTVPALIGAMDWNSVLEKLWAISYWILVAAVILFRNSKPVRHRYWVPLITALVSLIVFRLGTLSERSWASALSMPQFDVGTALEHHSAFDASFAAADELLATYSARPCNPQCQYILHQTNIPATGLVKLHNVDLVQHLTAATSKTPNIFVIVVDSLRQDYISAYNPAVSFTPAIGAFAKDSTVFHNAFTRYGGTTLSEPSIWAGMMQLHKQYPQPFHLVNGLEKLIQVDGYKSFITVDISVLVPLLQPRPDTVRLDETAAKWTDVDFCSTANEALEKIGAQQDQGRPIFLYTQPKNLHIITLGKTIRQRPPKKNYSPFVNYYASELERLDGCFGNFIQGLRNRHLYDNSIIVFTADHGDDLSTMATDRHVFSLKPGVIRVPLIIHVPPQVKQSWYYDPDAIAFNTDITPTLYELLGHGPVIARQEFGRPLFTKTKEDAAKYVRDSYMIASSYGPLYGLLSNKGNKLFIENELTGAEGLFDLQTDPEFSRNLLTEKNRIADEAKLRLYLGQIADLYGYTYRPPTILTWLMH